MVLIVFVFLSLCVEFAVWKISSEDSWVDRGAPDFGSSATCPEPGLQCGKTLLVAYRDACA